MSEIYLGHGSSIEPDDGPRDTQFHKAITTIKPILGTKHGNRVTLECLHQVVTYGKLEKLDGVVRCMQCRDAHRHQAN